MFFNIFVANSSISLLFISFYYCVLLFTWNSALVLIISFQPPHLDFDCSCLSKALWCAIELFIYAVTRSLQCGHINLSDPLSGRPALCPRAFDMLHPDFHSVFKDFYFLLDFFNDPVFTQ